MNTFDYIIVGAGSAGCVLARRLTEDPTVRVLLLEAGEPDRRREIHIPAAFSKLFRSECDWNYTTTPQPGLGGRELYWPRGKVLGGSSSINAMMYVRGHRSDYDRWRDAGNAGWGYDDVLPLFKRSEHQELGPSKFHGKDGPLNVANVRTLNPLSKAFVESAVERGLARTDDFNGADQDGAGFYQVTQLKGRRHSAAAAFLTPILGRPNLTVETGALAHRVLIENGRAVGVDYARHGGVSVARADREVILAGGAVNSPQLLMLSGIGPADHLREHGIPVVVDAPEVGGNLQDHLLVVVAHQSRRPVGLANAESLPNIARYLMFRTGPLASNIGEAGAFIRTSDGLEAPDLQIIFAPAYYLNHGFTKVEGHGFSVGTVQLRPYSRGRIRLRSANPKTHPEIDPSYLTDERDLALLVEGVKRCRDMVQGRALDALRGDEYTPGADARDDSALSEFVRRSAETLYHPVGTCRMGADIRSVVDPELRVCGVERLRVVDASIMPDIVGGNTNAPTIMIGEKGAELIRGG